MEPIETEEKNLQDSHETSRCLQIRGGALTVSKQEWEQIEQVPPHTRAVGALFQAAARELQSGEAGPVKKQTFNLQLFTDLGGAVMPPTSLKKILRPQKRLTSSKSAWKPLRNKTGSARLPGPSLPFLREEKPLGRDVRVSFMQLSCG